MTTSSHIPGLEGRPPAPPRRGFTLIEMIIVMTIIGIIVSLILIASRDGIRQAEMRATQALILKLEGGLNDRLDALMQLRPEPNFCHGYLAGIYPGGTDPDGGLSMVPPALLPTGYPDTRVRNAARAQTIALADYIKSEVPDVFFVQEGLTGTPGGTSYPLNFAAVAYPGAPTVPDLGGLANYILPLGHMVHGPRCSVNSAWATGYGDSNFTGVLYSSNPQLGLAGRGIFGASYSVAAGIYKNLGYGPRGYDMVDNNGNGLVDEWAEGILGLSGDQVNEILARLRSHTHETARSEMLYALLVEGQGLLGSTFKPDDFSDREVQDTDGDGLPEFVDAWGKPLQFYRWPTYYHSDAQRGVNIGTDVPGSSGSGATAFLRPYNSNIEAREQNPLDPNQTLMAPAWWLASQNVSYPGFGAAKGAPINASGGVDAYETYFHPLTEPMVYNVSSPTDAGKYWDRGGYAGLGYRRAFLTKPLILSGGPDGQLGVSPINLSSYASREDKVNALIKLENNAPQFSPAEIPSGGIPPGPFTATTYPKSFLLWDAGRDDVSNHTVTAAAGSGG